MMEELRKLLKLLYSLVIHIEARWLPSAVNLIAESLSHTWSPGYIRISQRLLCSICRQYGLNAPKFRLRSMNESLVACLKVVKEQLTQAWGDDFCRLWNPPFDFLRLVIRKIEQKGSSGILLAPH